MTAEGELCYEETIGGLERVIAASGESGDRAGYFAAMYLAVTRTVQERAASGRFENPERMERFVSGFAARYLDAHRSWAAGAPCTDAWVVALTASAQWRPVILQHLLLGMNAHINLDLGVAASAFAVEGSIESLRGDFDAINDVLAELVAGFREALGRVSPWIGLADRVSGRHEDTVVRFSLVLARQQAWDVAVRLAASPPAGRDDAVADADRRAAGVGRAVRRPGLVGSTLLLVVRIRERAHPRDVMGLLAAVRPTTAGG